MKSLHLSQNTKNYIFSKKLYLSSLKMLSDNYTFGPLIANLFSKLALFELHVRI